MGTVESFSIHNPCRVILDSDEGAGSTAVEPKKDPNTSR